MSFHPPNHWTHSYSPSQAQFSGHPPTQSRPQSFRTRPAELPWSSRARLPRGKVFEHGQNHGLRTETAWIRITALLPVDTLGLQCAHLESEDDGRTYLGRVVGMTRWMNARQGVDSGRRQQALEICELKPQWALPHTSPRMVRLQKSDNIRWPQDVAKSETRVLCWWEQKIGATPWGTGLAFP